LSVSWQIDEPDHVLRQFKKLGHIEQKHYRQAILDLALSRDPKRLGKYEDNGCYSYRLTKSSRLIYRVYSQQKFIQLVSVGDHKEVYGKGS
jgi:mRNA-degrading endonuclease RelE of RelBE toxin-antitoxin system